MFTYSIFKSNLNKVIPISVNYNLLYKSLIRKPGRFIKKNSFFLASQSMNMNIKPVPIL